MNLFELSSLLDEQIKEIRLSPADWATIQRQARRLTGAEQPVLQIGNVPLRMSESSCFVMKDETVRPICL